MAKKSDDNKDKKKAGPRISNHKARHEYHIVETLECGLELVGTEVKSLRAGQAKIDEAYVRIRGGEVFLVGANIATYPLAGPLMQHDPTRDRRLLVHRRQIAALTTHVKQKGKTIVPLAVYFHRGWAKVEIALAEGKKMFDKRQDLKSKQAQRDIQREMNRRR